jgi:hypothetical protein
MRDLDAIPVEEWTIDEQREHLAQTFDRASKAKAHADLMEPYVIALSDCGGEADRVEAMRRGLRETFKCRYPEGGAMTARSGTSNNDPS